MKESYVTELAENVANEAEPTITVGDTTYAISDLSDEIKEMLSIHEQASQMLLGAKRQAIIHELAVSNIAALIEKKLSEVEE